MILPRGAPVLTAAAMREAEAAAMATGVSQDDLMERAGLAVAREARRFATGRPILVLAGPGNNGGDGYVAARHLAAWGHDVVVAALARPGTGAPARMAAAWTGRTIPLAGTPPRPFVIDALFGTGLSRALTVDLTPLRAAAQFVLAVDLPSGVATDTGADPGGALRADATLALDALKPAHVLNTGLCGTTLLADIGIPTPSAWRTIARPHIAPPARDAHKYRAMVLVVAGAMPGAARLAALGAGGAGAGYILLAGDALAPGPRDAVVHHPLPDAQALADLLADDRIGCVVIGPGLGRDDRAHALLGTALASPRTLLIDGDALTLMARDAARHLARRTAPSILTPHDGEFARMFDAGTDRIADTLAAARACRATIVRKGTATVIATPDGRATIASGASSWLATAGTGDVLAGAIAARIADGGHAADGVWLHARAATLAGPAFDADALAPHLPKALAACR